MVKEYFDICLMKDNLFESGNAEQALRVKGIKYEKVKLAADILFYFSFLRHY